jgi:hypothetical protein
VVVVVVKVLFSGGDNMKVSKLIEILQQQKPQKQALITWEGIFREITPKNIYLSPDGRVIIDAGGNYYKKSIMNGEHAVSSRKDCLKNR